MKKTELIQKIQERFQSYDQNVAVVVEYKGVKYSEAPRFFGYKGFQSQTIQNLKPFLYGEIVEEKQSICKNPAFQYLTFRSEAAIDTYRLAAAAAEDEKCLIGITKFEMGQTWSDSNTGVMYAPSHLTLPQIKLLVNEYCENYNIPDAHILIQSLDYPVFDGLRDRQSPQPNWLKLAGYEKSLASSL